MDEQRVVIFHSIIIYNLYIDKFTLKLYMHQKFDTIFGTYIFSMLTNLPFFFDEVYMHQKSFFFDEVYMHQKLRQRH